MKYPKVSIILPIYNVEKYLDRCMDSLLNQTLKDIEIIMVDDGSPDNCPQMCDEYAKEILKSGRQLRKESFYDDYSCFVDGSNYQDYDYPYSVIFNQVQFEQWKKCHKKVFDGFDDFIKYVKNRKNERDKG